ncbi:TetR/AcrR family transcriptional regulator [Falsiroseomonas selenitidurans]|uniref:TetR/AcrR family transcriptional regulator n=1 Tax=Falsiroseomonas selenitidurans TaxID=2716335 RepID=A0ABX1E5B1_9PROT|nr:TetR/AcrR family transcriptional regulator [Falsiroseomonas selenitidurans]NKC32389.1 TetR/AcrR family transcriptional regulator [Falsiroseomonas selenitidurans]
MSVTPKARGRHHHGDLRRALLDAVAEIVLEAGPERVSLRECARRAGVSHSAAAPHFGDKRGLLTAFATEKSERLRAAMEQAVADLPPGADARAVLAATGHGYLGFARDNPAHFRLMFRTDLIDTADPAWRHAAQAARDPLDRAMAALVPAADAAALRARLAFAWAAVHGFCTLRAELPRNELWHPAPRGAEVAEDLVALVVRACAAPERSAD